MKRLETWLSVTKLVGWDPLIPTQGAPSPEISQFSLLQKSPRSSLTLSNIFSWNWSLIDSMSFCCFLGSLGIGLKTCTTDALCTLSAHYIPAWEERNGYKFSRFGYTGRDIAFVPCTGAKTIEPHLHLSALQTYLCPSSLFKIIPCQFSCGYTHIFMDKLYPCPHPVSTALHQLWGYFNLCYKAYTLLVVFG